MPPLPPPDRLRCGGNSPVYAQRQDREGTRQADPEGQAVKGALWPSLTGTRAAPSHLLLPGPPPPGLFGVVGQRQPSTGSDRACNPADVCNGFRELAFNRRRARGGARLPSRGLVRAGGQAWHQALRQWAAVPVVLVQAAGAHALGQEMVAGVLAARRVAGAETAAGQPIFFQVSHPVVWKARSLLEIVTVAGPAVFPLAMISSSSPEVPLSRAQ